MRKKCPYSEIFWSLLSHIRTRKTRNTDTFHAVILMYIYTFTSSFSLKPRETLVSIPFFLPANFIAQKVKFSIKDFFSKCYQIRRRIWIWSHLLRKILNAKLHFLCSVYLAKEKSTLKFFKSKLTYLVKTDFLYIKMLILMSILVCHRYFNMTRIFCVSNTQTVCNIKPKPWSHISGLGSWVLGLLSWFLDPKS